MAAQTSAVTAQNAEFAAKATECASQLDQMLMSLVNRLSGLQENWRGSGGTAFQSTLATVQSETKRMNNALNGIAADVGIVGRGYVAGDEEQGSAMNNVNSATTGITSSLLV